MTKAPPTLTEEDLATLEREGSILKPGFFSSEDVDHLRETVQRLRPVSMAHRKPSRRWLLTSPSNAFRQCRRPEIREDLVHLAEVARDRGFKRFSGMYYGRDVRLDHIMSIESPASEEAITPWHSDANFPADDLRPADRFTLKYFIYLNDVGPDNGAFSFIPRTHRLVTTLREGINAGAIPHFWTGRIPTLKEALAKPKVADYVLGRLGRGALDEFEDAARRTKDGELGVEEFYLNGPAGTLAIFDDRGLHRGGIPRKGPRSVLRYNYIPAVYWREQFTTPRYWANMALKAMLPGPVAEHWAPTPGRR